MATDAKTRVTEILSGLSGGSTAQAQPSSEDLFQLVYRELHALAERYMRRERPDHTLQPAALVNEAYLRLVDDSSVDWRGRTHFFAVGANIMRRALVDRARARRSQKRGGNRYRVTLAHAGFASSREGLDPEQLLSLDRALEQLGEMDERAHRVVELRFFAGLTIPETAAALGVSKRTVETDWAHARAWLKRELSPETA